MGAIVLQLPFFSPNGEGVIHEVAKVTYIFGRLSTAQIFVFFFPRKSVVRYLVELATLPSRKKIERSNRKKRKRIAPQCEANARNRRTPPPYIDIAPTSVTSSQSHATLQIHLIIIEVPDLKSSVKSYPMSDAMAQLKHVINNYSSSEKTQQYMFRRY